MEEIVLLADKIKFSGPRVDGSYSVTLETGEYEQGKIAQLMALPQQTPLKISISIYDKQG
jgi:hypothetical protein